MTEADKKTKWSLLDTFPYISVLIILVGISYAQGYHTPFGIDILRYLDFSELILYFLDASAIPILIVSFSSLFVFFVFDPIYSKLTQDPLKSKALIDELGSKPIWYRRISIHIRLTSTLFWTAVTWTITFIFLDLLHGEVKWQSIGNMLLLYLAVSIIQIALRELTLTSLYHSMSSGIKKAFWYILFSLALVIMSFVYGFYVAGDVKKVRGYRNVTISFCDNKEFHSTSTSFVVGKTNNYIFIFNQTDTTTDIVPVSSIKKIIYDLKQSSRIK